MLALLTVAAEARRSDPSPLSHYMRARIAHATDRPAVALKSYSDALIAAPATSTVAFRAYRLAVEAGDFALALRAAQALERGGAVPPDAYLLYYISALRERDWAKAKLRLDALDRESSFAFLVPILRDWLALATGEAAAEGVVRKAEPNAYSAESRALLLLARGQTADGLTAVRSLWSVDPYRSQSLRIAAASTLSDNGLRADAAALLIANDNATERAKSLTERKRRLGMSVDTSASGTAFVLARMAGDLITANSGRSALTMARLAQFADPGNARIALIVAGALSTEKHEAAALSLTDRLRDDPIYGDDAASLRIDVLEASGKVDQAVAEAALRAKRSINDLSRIGDIEARRGRHEAAAASYRSTIAAMDEAKVSWTLWYAAGNALDAAGQWTAAKPYLERALALAPDEPAILNELGYGLIDNGESFARASALLEKANALRPDDAAIADSLGWAFFRQGQIDRAIPALERAVVLDYAQPEIGEHLGDAYWRAGRRIDARYAWVAARVQAEGAHAERLDAKIARGPVGL